ncbi:MAG: ATP-binding protein, partial [Oscillospiraceae bacterium]
ENIEQYDSDDIVNLCTNSAYTITKLDKNNVDIKKHIDEIDKNGAFVETSGFLPNAVAIVSVKGEYFRINTFAKENYYWAVYFVVIVAFIVCIILGTILTAFMSRVMLQPLWELNKATAEVAKGNFSVRVKVPKDEEYGMLARNFNKMAEELSGIETLRGDFISNVSHEFKTPLASIQGFAKLLQDESLSKEDRHEYTQIIIDETSRLSKLASNILKLSKLENQTTIGKKTRFSLDEQIRKIILMLEPEWSKKNINLDIALDDIYYYGNEELMGQIWQNIINNAIKFTPQDGEIKVQLYQTESNITARISDNGIGISHEAKEKIFEKFYQGDHSRKTEGNGLGLALVKRIVDLCEGKIYVENLYEGGVCFVVELPFVVENMK